MYLLEKDSINQKKADKSDLSRSLLNLLNKEFILVSDEDENVPHVSNSDVIIDFMSVVRRFSAIKRNDIKSFGAFSAVVLNAIISYGRE